MTRRLCRPRQLSPVCLAMLACSLGWCGPVLEDILNGMALGPHSGARSELRHCTIESGAPVGQTFVVGEGVVEVARIALWQAFWHETWQPDESLVLTLWDSPQKRTSYGREAIPYSRRMWEGATPMFTLEARVAPGRSYYMELTVETEPLRPAETPREWLLSGRRPGFANGDGTLAGIGTAQEDYPEGSAYVGGVAQDFDLWFEVHVRSAPDRDALYRRALSYFDLTRPDMEQVSRAAESRDWDRAMAALVQHFEGRPDLVAEQKKPALDLSYDTRLADLACEHRVLLEDGVTTVDLGPRWNHFALWPERGGVGLTRSGLRKWLAAGYSATGNEKYARAFTELLFHFFRQAPSPVEAGVYRADEIIPCALPAGLAGGSVWSALSIGARLGHGLHYYAAFMDSPHFPLDVRAAFIINLAQMAQVLERMKGGGNWETQMAEALMDTGFTYPEFRGAPGWVQQGLETLIENARSTVRPDGVLQEPSIGYHMLVMNRYSSVLERAGPLGLELPPDLARITEGMFNYVMYSVLPDGTLPVWGDANHPMRPDLLERGAALFGRPDFRYVFTGGKEGTPPARTSIAFPDSGYFISRSSWAPDAHMMALHCGPYGSHGHQDTLSFTVASFGDTVLIDPGVSTYGTPEARELSATVSHNTVTADGRDARPGVPVTWQMGERFDYFAGHNQGYRRLEDVRHHRRVWCLKPAAGAPAIWLVLDDLLGEGEVSGELRFRFAPLPVHQAPGTRAVWTAGPGGNVLIHALDDPSPQLSVQEGIAVWHKLTHVPVACFSRRCELPQAFTTLMLPFRGQVPPEYHARMVPVMPAQPGARAVWLTLGDQAVLALCGPLPASAPAVGPLTATLPDGRTFSATAEAVAVRFQHMGEVWAPTLLHAVNASRVLLGGRWLHASSEPTAVVDLVVTEG